MSNKEERYVLYEYLLYFWRKKWAFLIVPLISIVLALAVNYVVKIKDTPKYTGESTVYAGSIKSQEVSNPKNILAKYKKDLKNKDVKITPSNGYLKTIIRGNDKKTIEEDLKLLTENMKNDLLKQYDLQIEVTKQKLKTFEEDLPSLKKQLENYRGNYTEQYEQNVESFDIADLTAVVSNLLLLWAESEYSDSKYSIHKMENDIALFEKPATLGTSITPTNYYIPESAVIGLLLGIVLTFALLTLLKYIEDARRYYSAKKGKLE